MRKFTYLSAIIAIIAILAACPQLPPIDGTGDGDTGGDTNGGGDSTPANILVFASDRDGDFEIYSLNLDTDEISQLTSNTATDKHPDLSADGTKIAFVSDRDGSWGIYTMNVDGTGVSSKLASLSGSFWGHPSWSPDGTKIAYDDNFDIHTMESDGLGLETLDSSNNDLTPDWSPDGGEIAFSSAVAGDDYEIYIVDSDFSASPTPAPLTDNSDIADQEPSWSPDGTQIAYSSDPNSDSIYEIYVMNSDGTGTPENLTNTPGDVESFPSWGSQGIAYVKNNEIFTLVPGSAEPPTNVTDNAAADQDPSWE